MKGRLPRHRHSPLRTSRTAVPRTSVPTEARVSGNRRACSGLGAWSDADPRVDGYPDLREPKCLRVGQCCAPPLVVLPRRVPHLPPLGPLTEHYQGPDGQPALNNPRYGRALGVSKPPVIAIARRPVCHVSGTQSQNRPERERRHSTALKGSSSVDLCLRREPSANADLPSCRWKGSPVRTPSPLLGEGPVDVVRVQLHEPVDQVEASLAAVAVALSVVAQDERDEVVARGTSCCT